MPREIQHEEKQTAQIWRVSTVTYFSFSSPQYKMYTYSKGVRLQLPGEKVKFIF